jgi:hypothetical protein
MELSLQACSLNEMPSFLLTRQGVNMGKVGGPETSPQTRPDARSPERSAEAPAIWTVAEELVNGKTGPAEAQPSCNQYSEDDLDEWIEEEALHVSCEDSHSGSSDYSLDILLCDPPLSSSSRAKIKPEPGISLTVTFDQQPLGLTLSANAEGLAEVVRTKDGGRAMQLGINAKDILTAVDGISVASYQDTMHQLSHAQLPIRLTFYRTSFLRYHQTRDFASSNWHNGSPSSSAKIDDNHDHLWSLRRNMTYSNVERIGRVSKSYS